MQSQSLWFTSQKKKLLWSSCIFLLSDKSVNHVSKMPPMKIVLVEYCSHYKPGKLFPLFCLQYVELPHGDRDGTYNKWLLIFDLLIQKDFGDGSHSNKGDREQGNADSLSQTTCVTCRKVIPLSCIIAIIEIIRLGFTKNKTNKKNRSKLVAIRRYRFESFSRNKTCKFVFQGELGPSIMQPCIVSHYASCVLAENKMKEIKLNEINWITVSFYRPVLF